MQQQDNTQSTLLACWRPQSCYTLMCPHHPQLQRFGIGRLASFVPTLSLKQIGTSKVSLPMPDQVGTTKVSPPGCSHLLYMQGRKNTSGMQIICDRFCEISSGELQITCTKSIVQSHTLVLCTEPVRKHLRMCSHSRKFLYQRRALRLPFWIFCYS